MRRSTAAPPAPAASPLVFARQPTAVPSLLLRKDGLAPARTARDAIKDGRTVVVSGRSSR